MTRSRIKPRNAERRAKTFARAFGPKSDWIRAQPCLVRGCRGFTVAAHAIARGAGSAKGDLSHLVPLCQAHHEDAGERGTTDRAAFEALHGLARGLVAIAAEYHARWESGEDAGAPF